MPALLHHELLELYRQVDAEVVAAGPVCVASGRCCRFKEYGHTLFLSRLEAEVLLANAPPFSTPVDSSFCPFQQGNLCTAREPRPLGCRIYFCDPAYQETMTALSEKYIARLKQLADAAHLDWYYAPLHHFLREATAAQATSVAPLQPTPHVPGASRAVTLSLPLIDLD